MSVSKVVFFASAVLVLVGLLFVNKNEIDAKQNDLEEVSKNAAPQTSSASKGEADDFIDDKVSGLNADNQAGDTRVNTLPNEGKVVVSSNSEDVNQQALYTEEEQLSQFADSVLSKAPELNAHEVDELFVNEERDEIWASDLETKVYSLIQQDQTHGFIMENLSCKTTRCQLDLNANGDNGMYIGAMFSATMQGSEWQGTFHSVNFDPRVVDGTFRVTIHRYEPELTTNSSKPNTTP